MVSVLLKNRKFIDGTKKDYNTRICLWLARTESALPGNNHGVLKYWSNGPSMNITETEMYDLIHKTMLPASQLSAIEAKIQWEWKEWTLTGFLSWSMMIVLGMFFWM